MTRMLEPELTIMNQLNRFMGSARFRNSWKIFNFSASTVGNICDFHSSINLLRYSLVFPMSETWAATTLEC